MDFENLIQELKLEIFDYLPYNDLKNAATICKSWRETIFHSTTLLRKFELLIVVGMDQFKSGPYDDDETHKKRLKEFLNEYGHIFPFVNIRGRFPMMEFKEIMYSIPNVHHIVLNHVSLKTPPKKSYYDKIFFPNLKKISSIKSSNIWKVTNFLKNANIEDLYIDYWTTENVGLDEQYMDWFNRRHCLKHLEVVDREWGNTLKLFTNMDVNHIQFKLKSFKLKCSEILGNKNDDLLKFLQSQNELEKVALCAGYVIFSSNIFTHVFYEMKNLNNLEIRIYAQTNVPNEVFANFRTNQNMKSFKYVDKSFDESNTNRVEMFKKTVKIFPNLKELDLMISCLDGSILNFLSGVLDNLETLKIGRLKTGNYAQMRFKNLKKLTIDGCTIAAENWTTVLSQNPKIEALSVDNFYLDFDAFKAIVLNSLNLKHLEFNSGLYPKGFLQIVSEHKKLKCLKIRSETMEQFKEELSCELNFDVRTTCEKRSTFYYQEKDYFIQLCNENPELLNSFHENWKR